MKTGQFISVLALWLVTGCIPMKSEFGQLSRGMYQDQITIPIDLPANAPSVSQLFWLLPDDGGGAQNRNEHLGIDITAQRDTPVIAPADGVVVSAFFEPMYGNRIVVEHDKTRDGKRIQTSYWHLNNRKVEVGDKVRRGQLLGGLGNTGAMASGILHVHFAVLEEQPRGEMRPVDPSRYWSGGVGKVECYNPHRYWPRGGTKFTYPVACAAKK